MSTQPTATNTASRLASVYCTDEHVAIRAGGDFVLVTPQWQILGQGTDGAISAGSWDMSSSSTTFDAGGLNLAQGNVIVLQKPVTAFPGQGQMFAVESVSGSTCTLRRIGYPAGVGAPPCLTSVSPITFVIPTLGPQIEEASFQINQTWGIDQGVGGRDPNSIYDPRVLRRLAVLQVLFERYSQEARKPDGDFALKFSVIRQEYFELKGQCQVRWGTAGKSQPSTTLFSGRVTR